MYWRGAEWAPNMITNSEVQKKNIFGADKKILSHRPAPTSEIFDYSEVSVQLL
jgi:hypothetical protein